jgi:hypothetical protein
MFTFSHRYKIEIFPSQRHKSIYGDNVKTYCIVNEQVKHLNFVCIRFMVLDLQ